jgi:hypothetical protein
VSKKQPPHSSREKKEAPIAEIEYTLYICPECFEAFGSVPANHPHNLARVIICDPGEPGDERRKPVLDLDGDLRTHAPRWFLEATGLSLKD